MRVELQAAYLIHSRPYRDTSLLLECFTPHFGRVSCVARGVRGSNRRQREQRSTLQPFVPLLLSWSGNTDLKTLIGSEATGRALALQGHHLFSALYINELLIRLVPRYDTQVVLFGLYSELLQALAGDLATPIEPLLRRFELNLLDQLGYGLVLTEDADSGSPIEPGTDYWFDSEQSVFRRDGGSSPAAERFAGEQLLAIAAGKFDPPSLAAAKRLCRLALRPHLGDKPLKSRELFSRS